ncbi:hypothetical protein CU040_1540 [Enterococcus faecium]|nr:hypothetical protein [Enterococcus faecium]
MENAQALTDHFRDSDFTLQVIHEFFGLFKSIDGDVYRRDPSSLDKLQMIESDERKQKKQEVEKILLKQVNYLTVDDRQQIIAYAHEFLDEIMVEVTLISALCEILGIDIRKLSEERLSYWVVQGYMNLQEVEKPAEETISPKKKEMLLQVTEIESLLSNKELTLFHLINKDLCTYGEAAEQMNLAVGTVKSMSQRIKNKIDNYFEYGHQINLFEIC